MLEKCAACKAPEDNPVSLMILWNRVEFSLRPGSRQVSRIFPRSRPDEKRRHWRKFTTVILEETPTLAVSQRKAWTRPIVCGIVHSIAGKKKTDTEDHSVGTAQARIKFMKDVATNTLQRAQEVAEAEGALVLAAGDWNLTPEELALACKGVRESDSFAPLHTGLSQIVHGKGSCMAVANGFCNDADIYGYFPEIKGLRTFPSTLQSSPRLRCTARASLVYGANCLDLLSTTHGSCVQTRTSHARSCELPSSTSSSPTAQARMRAS